jgi:predicted PolB exonuclease-like 3'-5' exonuclease
MIITLQAATIINKGNDIPELKENGTFNFLIVFFTFLLSDEDFVVLRNGTGFFLPLLHLWVFHLTFSNLF